MLILIQTISCLSFAYVAYLLSGVLSDSLKKGRMLEPIVITLCIVTIAYHLHNANVWMYILASFAGFFLHTCTNGFTKKVKATASNKRKKVVNINP